MYYDQVTGWQRLVMKYLLFLVLAVAGMDLTFHMISRADRSELHVQQKLIQDQQAQIEAFQVKNRIMLDARGRLQITAFRAILGQRSFSASEVIEIEQLWQAAQYNLIQERFLIPKDGQQRKP